MSGLAARALVVLMAVIALGFTVGRARAEAG